MLRKCANEFDPSAFIVAVAGNGPDSAVEKSLLAFFMASVDKVADQCRAKALQSSTFGMLTEDEREALMADCEMHTHTPNKVIIQQGSVNKSLYIISLGKATVEIDGNIGTSNTACVGCVFVNLIVLHSVCLLYSCFNLDTWYDVFYSCSCDVGCRKRIR